MHTYTKSKDGLGWQAGFAIDGPTGERTVSPLGPVFETEAEAAALVSYLNGGSYSPGDVADVLKLPEGETEAEKDEAAREKRRAAEKANRPPGMDYPPEDQRNPNPNANPNVNVKPKAPAHAAQRKPDVKRALPKRKHR